METRVLLFRTLSNKGTAKDLEVRNIYINTIKKERMIAYSIAVFCLFRLTFLGRNGIQRVISIRLKKIEVIYGPGNVLF